MVPPLAHTNGGAYVHAQRSWWPWTAQAAARATAAALGLLWGATAQADPNAEFLAALREAGWNDTAREFVDWVADSPLVTEEFREQLTYERAVSLAAEGRTARDRDERRQKMAEAAAAFQGFAEADAESDEALGAMRQAANLYAELALAELADAEQGNDASRRTARELFEQATAAAEQLRDVCTARLAKLPKPAVIQSDPEAMEQRDQLRNRLAEAGFLIALVSFENARTYEAGSSGQNDALDQASDQFGALVEEYRGTLVGASSRFYQGRCAQELGEHAKALGCFEDLIDLPPAETAFRRWTARAHRRRAESLLALDKIGDAVRSCKQ
jgi:tetratricopeptide (TPR) repeat protein